MYYDTWNALDTVTISCVLVSFVFRMMGRNEERWNANMDDGEGHWFFVAQVLLAVSGPLLFARALLLSQVDDALGPMTQVRSR